jgi:hypothetical protein
MEAVAKMKTLSLLDIEPHNSSVVQPTALFTKKYTALCLYVSYDTLTDRKSAVGGGK